jgi:histidinol-phosphatase (PHP family)
VQKNIALEINTRGTYDWQNRVGPEDWVLERYRELGGKYVTIGSDAHVTKYVGAGFTEAAAALKRTGFDSYTIYKDRCPVQIPLT